MSLDPAHPPREGVAPDRLLRGLNGGTHASATGNESRSAPEGRLDRLAVSAALRARSGRLAPAGRAEGEGTIPLCPEIDGALPGRGLSRAALHEILPDGTGAAQGFAALLMARSGGAVFWIARSPDGPPPGLARFGVAPSRLIILRPDEQAEALWAAEEALRCAAVSAVLLSGAAPGEDALRRLQLAAETGGGIGLLLRDAEEDDAAHLPVATSWKVTGRGGDGAGDLGDPQWTLDLLRCRAGRPRSWAVTWRAGLDSLVPDEDLRDEAPLPAPARPRRR